MNYQKTKIVDITVVADGYALLRFKGDSPVAGVPGQFVMIRGAWGVDPILPRAFSIVESGDTGAVLVRNVGKGTDLLCNMNSGDELFVLGPLGNGYTLPSNGETPVLVAGGVGVAPLVFLAQTLKDMNFDVQFLYGARGSADLPLSEQIKLISNLIVTTEDGSAGQKGLVTPALEQTLQSFGSSIVYSCGPHPMLKAVGQVAQKYNAECQVALESPMACGMGTCKGCAVVDAEGNFKYVCTDGPVFQAQNIFGGLA
jgi:dihydroorotate dehydrogenase electron transfer subunit